MKKNQNEQKNNEPLDIFSEQKGVGGVTNINNDFDLLSIDQPQSQSQNKGGISFDDLLKTNQQQGQNSQQQNYLNFGLWCSMLLELIEIIWIILRFDKKWIIWIWKEGFFINFEILIILLFDKEYEFFKWFWYWGVDDVGCLGLMNGMDLFIRGRSVEDKVWVVVWKQ